MIWDVVEMKNGKRTVTIDNSLDIRNEFEAQTVWLYPTQSEL